MRKAFLVPHQLKYASVMSHLSSNPQVKDSLELSDAQTSLEGTMNFIEFMLEQEKLGKQYSRCILNEDGELIGVITLKDIDVEKKISHMGTWLGHAYWGRGYNQLAKAEILHTGFNELDLDYVFIGARADHVRSLKAQEKLPYITLSVEGDFPEEHKKLESRTHSKCVLNVIEKEKFLTWYKKTM